MDKEPATSGATTLSAAKDIEASVTLISTDELSQGVSGFGRPCCLCTGSQPLAHRGLGGAGDDAVAFEGLQQHVPRLRRDEGALAGSEFEGPGR